MMKKFFLLAVFLFCAAFVVAVESDKNAAVKTPADSTVPLYSDPNITVKVAKGAKFTLRLQSNPTTGYKWSLAAKLSPLLRLQDSRFLPPDGQLIGAGGTEEWIFEALKKGKTVIKFKYSRSWEKDVPAVKEAVFNVEVR